MTRPMHAAPRIPRTLATAALSIAASCGDSAPRYTLQQVMFQVDYLDKALAVALQDGAGAAEAGRRAEELARWWRDGAFGRHLESPKFSGDRGSFEARRAAFDGVLAELRGALAAGELDGAREAFRKLHESCDACHAEFRPQLLATPR